MVGEWDTRRRVVPGGTPSPPSLPGPMPVLFMQVRKGQYLEERVTDFGREYALCFFH